jgi:hypothetical protein
MFTLLPSLYLIGVRFFRRSYGNQIEPADSSSSFEVNVQQSHDNDITLFTTPTPARLHLAHRRSRKRRFTTELLANDIRYLTRKTSWTVDEIVLWHRNFLVRSLDRCVVMDEAFLLFSWTVPMVNCRKKSSSSFIKDSTRTAV